MARRITSSFLLCILMMFAAKAQFNPANSTIHPTDPEDTAFSDLQRIRSIFEGRRVVLLGEQAHSEGSVFREKVRMIKFLHQHLGFNIIAFESGLYDCYMALEDARKENSIEPMQASVFGIWSDTRELTPLFEYILETQKTANPLILAGFDDLSTSRYQDAFWQDIIREARLSEEEQDILEPVLFGTAEHVKDQDSVLQFNALLGSVEARLPENSRPQRILKMAFSIWSQGVRWQLDELNGKKTLVQNPRDKFMADGLTFLTKEYAGMKIIGWGASFHFANKVERFKNSQLTKKYAEEMRDMDHDEEPFDLDSALTGAIPMGKFLKNQFREELFSLAFSAYQGAYQFIGEDTIRLLTPPEESFEHVINKYAENAIVTFPGDTAWFYSSALGHLPVYANWPQIFDGIYFMRDLRPPTHIAYEEEVIHASRAGGNRLYGRVIDRETLQPVPYASIQFAGTPKGIATNATGEFEINEEMAGYGLVISSIGYLSDTIMVDPGYADLEVKLEPREYLLSEVTIRDKPLTAGEILKRARKAVRENYATDPYNQEVYYSKINRSEDSIWYNEQGSVLLYYPDGYQPKTNSFAKILQYRLRESSSHRFDGMGLLWLVFSHDLILDNDNVLSRTGAYDYRIENVLAYQDRLVYHITFTCVRPNAFTTGFGYPAPETATGHIYIATDDFAILKYDLCVDRKPYTPRRDKNMVIHPNHHHLSQSFMRYKGKYILERSFIEMKTTTTNLETGKTIDAVQHQYVSSMEVNSANLVALTRPVNKLYANTNVKEDPTFYTTHGYILDQERQYEFYCNGFGEGE